MSCGCFGLVLIVFGDKGAASNAGKNTSKDSEANVVLYPVGGVIVLVQVVHIAASTDVFDLNDKASLADFLSSVDHNDAHVRYIRVKSICLYR